MPTSPTTAGPVSIPIRVAARPNAGAAEPNCCGGGAMAKALTPGLNGDGAFDGALRVTLKVKRCVEESMHAVSDDLVDHTAVLDHDASDTLEILVERCDQLLGTGTMHRGCEPLDVGKQ